MPALLTTPRLHLRELLPADDAGMFELDSDPEVHRYLGGTPLTSIDQSTKMSFNATLFSTGRLMESVAKKKDLPDLLVRENKANAPAYAIITISVLAAALAVIGSLGSLVDAASLIFLITFGVVNFIAFRQKVRYRFFCLLGSLGCLAAVLISGWEHWQKSPVALLVMMGLLVFAFLGRPFILRKMNGEKE